MTEELNYHLAQTVLGRQSRRAFLGRALALGLSTLAAHSLLTTAVHAAGPVKGGHLKLALRGGDPTNRIAVTQSIAPVPAFSLRLLGDTLVEPTADGGLEMRLAEELSVSPDGLVWRLRPRKGVRFHNGQQLTPEDIRASLEWHRNPTHASGAIAHLIGVESIAVEGDQVAIYLKSPDFYFAQGLGDVALTITAGGLQGKGAVYSGGYRLVLDEPGVRHAFERVADYWDDSRAHVEHIELLVINDPVLRAAALASGEVHLANQIDPDHAMELSSRSDLHLSRARGGEMQGYGMQVTAKPYESADLRLALKYAVDRQAILQTVLKGHGSLGNDLPACAGFADLEEAIPQRIFDPELAEFHYRKARADGTPLILRVSDMAFPKATEAAAIFQASAKAANIPLDVRREESDLYWSEVWNRQPFVASAQAASLSATLALSAFRKDAPWNVTRFGDEAFEAGLVGLRSQRDPALRREAEVLLAQRLHLEGGLIAPVCADIIDGHVMQVSGYDVSQGGSLMGGYAGTKVWLS